MACSLTGSSVHGILRQEYLSGWPFPPPGDLPNPGVKAESVTPPALAGRFFTSSAIWEPMHQQICCLILVKHKKRYKIIFKNQPDISMGIVRLSMNLLNYQKILDGDIFLFWCNSPLPQTKFPETGNHLPYWAPKTNPNTEYQHRAVLVWSLAGYHLLPCGMWEIS